MKKYSALILWVGSLAVVAGMLLICEPHFLWKVQEMNLFLHSSLFFKEQLVVSGGLLTWLSAFFTQFLYYPWLGVTVLCLWWLLLMWLIQRTFCVPGRWAVLMLVPVALLLITIVDQGYWIYILKLRGHFFAATIGTTAVVALLWGYRCIPPKYCLRPLYIFLTAAVGYPLMGIYGLAAALLMGLWSWKLDRKSGALACCVVAVLAAVVVPLLCYRYVYYQTNLANIYYTGLPLYYVTEEYHAYYLPYYLLALFFVVMALTYGPRQKEPRKLKSSWAFLVGQVAVVALLAWIVAHFWYKDENYHHELAMQHSIEQLDWQGVIDEAGKQSDEPTRAIVMMRNLALSRLGRQGNEMFLFRNGSKAYNAPFDMRLMLVCGPLIYYQYGMLNYCNRLCTEMGVEFNWRPEYLKNMVKCAILSHEPALARKYLGLLRQTLFFGSWADWAENLLRHPDQIAADAELSAVSHMLHYNNVLSSDQGNIERFLMQRLAISTYADDPVFQEQALLATLWTHDIQEFWERFADYIRLHPGQSLPRYYQEAAYLYGKLQGREDLDRMPFDKSVKESFGRFMQFAPKYNDTDVEVAREALYPAFGQTYYYDYYTMSQLPEY